MILKGESGQAVRIERVELACVSCGGTVAGVPRQYNAPSVIEVIANSRSSRSRHCWRKYSTYIID
jgi:hypothetical protein